MGLEMLPNFQIAWKISTSGTARNQHMLNWPAQSRRKEFPAGSLTRRRKGMISGAAHRCSGITMKRERTSRAKNKIQGPLEGSLIKAGPGHYSDAPGVHLRSKSFAVSRSSLFNTELEAVIDMIARERVYRAMLAGRGRRLLMAPSTNDHDDATRR
jgi:hypothetical protein